MGKNEINLKYDGGILGNKISVCFKIFGINFLVVGVRDRLGKKLHTYISISILCKQF